MDQISALHGDKIELIAATMIIRWCSRYCKRDDIKNVTKWESITIVCISRSRATLCAIKKIPLKPSDGLIQYSRENIDIYVYIFEKQYIVSLHLCLYMYRATIVSEHNLCGMLFPTYLFNSIRQNLARYVYLNVYVACGI